MEEKRFEFNPYGETERYETIFNRSNIYDNDRITNVQFWIDAFQDSPNGRKGLTEAQRIKFSFSVDQYPDSSGVVNDFQIKIDGYDGHSRIIELDEVDPAQLFWAGKLFLKVAKHYGVDMKQQIAANNDRK